LKCLAAEPSAFSAHSAAIHRELSDQLSISRVKGQCAEIQDLKDEVEGTQKELDALPQPQKRGTVERTKMVEDYLKLESSM
jgi:hypothetical protein